MNLTRKNMTFSVLKGRGIAFSGNTYILAVGLLWLLMGCSKGPKPEVPENTPIILVTLDTLRSDRLPDYGYDQLETPGLSDFCKDAVLFERAYAHAALTLNSHASIMTGLLPARHGVRDNSGYVLEQELLTLAERLTELGYVTGAVISSMVLRSRTGMAQGFEFYGESLESGPDGGTIRNFAQRRGDQSLVHAKQWLQNRGDKPFFFWLHLYDPHTPYSPPAPFAQSYDGEVAYTDSLMKSFFDFLKQQGLYDRAMILVMSDHGEGLGDHGEEEHGMLLYRESIQVPLLIKYPGGQNGGAKVAEPVGLIDIYPTVEEAVGLPPSPVDGISLMRHGNLPGDRELYAESLYPEIHYGWHAQRSVIRKELHLIEGFATELYDVVADPAEHHDLYGERRIPPSMIRIIEKESKGKQSTSAISSEDQAMLESLGYTGSFNFGDNVKSLTFEELMGLRERLSEGHTLLNLGKHEALEEKMAELLKGFPNLNEARTLLAMSLVAREDYERAEYVVMEALAGSPRDHTLLTSLAEIKIEKGQWEDALTAALKAAALEPNYAANRLLPHFFDARRWEEAERIAAASEERGGDAAYMHLVLGRTAMLRSEVPAAVGHLDKAVKGLDEHHHAKQLISALVFLARSYTMLGQPDKSHEPVQRAFELDPSLLQSRLLFAESLLGRGELQRAADIVAEGRREDPEQPALLQLAARIALEQGETDRALKLAEEAMRLDMKSVIGPLAFAFISKAPLEETAKMARSAMSIDPEQPYAPFVLGRLAHAQKNYQKARDWYQKAIPHFEHYPDPNLYADTLFFLGDAEASLGDPNRALPYFQKAVEIMPAMPRNQVTLAALFARTGAKDQAVAVMDQWLAKFPNPKNYDLAARAMAQFGYEDAAARYRDKAASPGKD